MAQINPIVDLDNVNDAAPVPQQVPQQVPYDGPHIVKEEDRATSVFTLDSSVESYHSGETTSTSKYF